MAAAADLGMVMFGAFAELVPNRFVAYTCYAAAYALFFVTMNALLRMFSRWAAPSRSSVFQASLQFWIAARAPPTKGTTGGPISLAAPPGVGLRTSPSYGRARPKRRRSVLVVCIALGWVSLASA
jgi:hypothetical protein